MGGTYTYTEFAAELRRDKGPVVRAVDVIRRTVKARAPGILVAEIQGLRRPPVDRGTYLRSWAVYDIPNGARVYSKAPYAAVIESGRRPGSRMPPVDVIARWVRRKGLLGGKGGRSSPRAERQAAFMIARAIARRGVPGRWVLRHASVKIDAAIRKELRAAGL